MTKQDLKILASLAVIVTVFSTGCSDRPAKNEERSEP